MAAATKDAAEERAEREDLTAEGLKRDVAAGTERTKRTAKAEAGRKEEGAS